MTDAVRLIAERVRERVQATPGDGPGEVARAAQLARDEVRRYAEAALGGTVPLLRDEAEAEAQVVAAVAGLGPLQPYLDDPEVEEIWINEPHRVFIARGGRSELTPLVLSPAEARNLVERMLVSSGRRVDVSQPFVDASLADGSRLHVAIPDVTRAWSVNIRKFSSRIRDLQQLVSLGSLTREAAEFLRMSVLAGCNVLVAGATQAGKSTLLGALMSSVRRTDRVVTVEETFELDLAVRDVVAMQCRQASLQERICDTIEMSLRAAAYLRQSLDVSEGIERQQERTAALITARGWSPGPVYIDNAISASKARGKATAWARMLDEIGQEFDVLVAVDLDRLLRTTRDLNALIERGAKVVTVDGEIDLTTADGEFRATMLAGIARFETRRKSERMVRANEHRVSRGRASSVPRIRPFGFEKDGVTHREAEADAIRAAYDALLAGASLGGIARDWNAAGFTTGHGNEWTSGSVEHVLASPRYAGQVVYHRAAAGRAVWEPVVSDATWTAARARIAYGASGRGAYPRTLLGALARCGVCDDGTLVRGGSNNGRRSYRCDGKVQHLSRKAEDVEAYATAVVLELLHDQRVRDGLAAMPSTSDDEAEAQRIRDRLDQLAAQFADEAITASQLRVASDRLNARLRDVKGRMVAASAGAGLGALLTARSPTEAWEALDIAGRRRIIETLFDVTLLPGTRGRKTFDPDTVLIVPKAGA